MFKTETRMFIFSFAYVTMKPKVTLRLFSAFKGEYLGLQPETSFRSFVIMFLLQSFVFLNESFVF